jgi:rubrerythrin
MPELKGTQTETNLLKAFAGESQARNRYTYFASQAKKEGYVQIQSIFEETANHEKEHAKRLFKYLKSGAELEITAAFPAGTIGNTVDNLKEAAGGENYEYTTMYPEFAATAREEGFDDIAKTFESIAVAELYHEQRYLALMENIEKDRVFKRGMNVKWRCRNCGYNHEGPDAPEVCPACAHPQAHFELKPENY